MSILTTFKTQTTGIEKYLREDEKPLIPEHASSLNHEEIIQALSNHPLFYYRFSNGKELWNITENIPFSSFSVQSAWEETSPYPSKEDILAWLQTL